jgi:hypothetical protein
MHDGDGQVDGGEAVKFHGTYKPHYLATLFPRADAEDSTRIKNDILRHGCRVPIVIYEGQILDGWTRYDICVRHHKKPLFREFFGTREEAIAHVTSLNLCRRHLTQAQKSAIAVSLKKLLEEDGASSPEALDEASQEAKVSKDSVRRMERVAEKDKRVFKRVRDGRLSIAEAERTIDPPSNSRVAREFMLSAVAAMKRATEFLDEAPQSVKERIQRAITSSEAALKSRWFEE